MFNVDEARKLLASLPQNNPLDALDELAGWLGSVKSTPGFQPELRADILMLLDETAQPFHEELLKNYLAEAHLQDFNSIRMWQGILILMRALVDAYALCLDEYQQTEKKSPAFKEKQPVICVRLLRALAEQIKLELMRYRKIEPSLWQQLYQYYNFAVTQQLADTLIFAYSRGTPHTSSQRELLRAVLLHAASPATLAPEQIEVSYRIGGRLSSYFDFKDAPDANCAYCLDLAQPEAPKDVADKMQITPTMRFFGAVRAIPQLEEIINESARNQADPEQRLGKEFTPQGKLTVLKHLQVYWGKDHPYRRQERRDINTTIEIIHGFKIISKLVTSAELGQMAGVSEEEAQKLKDQSKFNLTDVEKDVDHVPETWDVLDVSVGGLGSRIPGNVRDWVKVGALCGLKAANSELWWVGMIRRLKTDDLGKVHVGIEILTKKPLSVWLRSLGKGTELISNWETSSGSFKHTYLPAILVPDAQNSYTAATMLMESGGYRADFIYEVMMEEKNNNIKLTALLAEGADYERISFQWLGPAAH